LISNLLTFVEVLQSKACAALTDEMRLFAVEIVAGRGIH
jgi:hypothetical protein